MHKDHQHHSHNHDTVNLNVNFMLSDDIKEFIKKLFKLNTQGDKIMSAISDFAAAQNEYNDKLEASLKGLGEDVNGLKAEIEKLNANPGALSPEDKASLEALLERSKSLSDKLAALDDLTPPKAPEEPAAPEAPAPEAPAEPAAPQE